MKLYLHACCALRVLPSYAKFIVKLRAAYMVYNITRSAYALCLGNVILIKMGALR